MFGDFVYHNGASTRLRSDIHIDGLTPADAASAWAEAVAEFLSPSNGSSDTELAG